MVGPEESHKELDVNSRFRAMCSTRSHQSSLSKIPFMGISHLQFTLWSDLKEVFYTFDMHLFGYSVLATHLWHKTQDVVGPEESHRELDVNSRFRAMRSTRSHQSSLSKIPFLGISYLIDHLWT